MKLRLRLPPPSGGTRVIVVDDAILHVANLKEVVERELNSAQLSLTQFSLSLNGKEALVVDNDSVLLSSVGIVPGDLIRLVRGTAAPPSPARPAAVAPVMAAAAAAMRRSAGPALESSGASANRYSSATSVPSSATTTSVSVNQEIGVASAASSRAPLEDFGVSCNTSDAMQCIMQLMEMGYTQEKAEIAVAASAGNLDLALDILNDDDSQLVGQSTSGGSSPKRFRPIDSVRQDGGRCASEDTGVLSSSSPSAGSRCVNENRLASLYRSADVQTAHQAMVVLLHWTVVELGCKSTEDSMLRKRCSEQGWWQLGSAAEHEYTYGSNSCRMLYIWMPRAPYGVISFSAAGPAQCRKQVRICEEDFVKSSAQFSDGVSTVYRDIDRALAELSQFFREGLALLPSESSDVHTTALPHHQQAATVPQPNAGAAGPAASLQALSAMYDQAAVKTAYQGLVVLLRWVLTGLEEPLGLQRLLQLQTVTSSSAGNTALSVDRRYDYRSGSCQVLYMSMPRCTCGVLHVTSVNYAGRKKRFSFPLEESTYVNSDALFSARSCDVYIDPDAAKAAISRDYVGRGLAFIDNNESQYDPCHLLGLPTIVLDMIFSRLDATSLRRLSMTSERLHGQVRSYREARRKRQAT